MQRKKKESLMKLFSFVLGKVLGGLLVLAGAVLLVGLMKLYVLTTEYTVVLLLLIALLTALVMVLTWSGKGKVRMTIGIVLAALVLGVLTTGSVYVWKIVNTIDNIASGNTETVHIGVYMRSDDDRTLEDIGAAGYQYGILQTIDREATDGAVRQMNEKLKVSISCKEYGNPVELVDALLDGQVDAIILNKEFLDMLAEEMPGYEEKIRNLREVFLQQVEIQGTQPVDPTTPDKPDVPDKPAAAGDAFIVYISGVDAAGKPSLRSRSDVNILAVVNPKTRQILLVSTPRDYFVPLSNSKGQKDKLTHAGNYGVNVSKDTMSMLYGTSIDYHFKVNFRGFKEIVDALGGITVNSERAFTTEMYGQYWSFKKGENKLNGQQALVFCRVRKAFADGDHQRGRNQMAVIRAVIDKLLSPELLKNYTSILDAIENSMETSVPAEVIGSLVSQQLSDSRPWNVVSYSATGESGWAVPWSLGMEASVIFPDQKSVDKAKDMIQAVLEGKTVTP